MMNKPTSSHTVRSLWLLLIGVCLLLAGIMFSATRKGKVSSHWSSQVTKVVTAKMTAVTGIEFNQYRSHIVVRKTGHFVEYSLLGVLVAGGVVILRPRLKRMQVNWGWGFFACMFIAVLDEFVQSFFNRSSCVSDVLFDFASSLLGIGVLLLILRYRRRRALRKQQKELPQEEPQET